MSDTIRVTIDLPKKEHRKLKATAAKLDISIQEYVHSCVVEELYKEHIPNKKTKKVLEEVKRGENLTVFKSVDDLLKALES